MITLTFEELDAIRAALATVVVCALDKDDESVEFGQRIRAWKLVLVALKEVENIEPKPKFKLTLEGE
ncbi:hypothetical protein [Fannyhessea vaginae]|uniref:hypothetical protein n=1 Tax=Fannyhessea vaginae TaxID=82135 RepID=UPI00206DFDBB|nr:hypothetical protein [Fannyhessea vaginae]DAK30261.1 MAG TPA: hypothetical protein [Caudoviricetes sp.]